MYTKSKIQQINECILYKNMFLENLNHLMDQYLIEDSIFVPYKEILKQEYSDSPFWNSVFVFQHFSMNRFTIDLKNFLQTEQSDNQVQALAKLGLKHKNEIF